MSNLGLLPICNSSFSNKYSAQKNTAEWLILTDNLALPLKVRNTIHNSSKVKTKIKDMKTAIISACISSV